MKKQIGIQALASIGLALLISALISSCSGSSSSNSGSTGFIPSFSVALPAAMKPATARKTTQRPSNFSNSTMKSNLACNQANCVNDATPEGRAKEFGGMINTPEFVMCIATHVWGLTPTNYNTLKTFTLDFGAINNDPTHACHGIIDLGGSNDSFNLKGKCFDLVGDPDYTFLCRAQYASNNSFAFELAFSVDSTNPTANYSGKGYLYANLGAPGWFKWDIQHGVSTELWTIKTDSPSPNYWSNYCYVKDDVATQTFSWQAIMGRDAGADGTYQGSPSTNLIEYSGVYDKVTETGRLNYEDFDYTSTPGNSVGPVQHSHQACFRFDTATNRLDGACDLNASSGEDCAVFSSVPAACQTNSVSGIPNLLSNLGYLKKYSSTGLSDGINDGIRLEEKYTDLNYPLN